VDLGETFRSSLESIGKNKTRSALTMLGIIIGVSAVILLVAIGQGLQNYITQQFETLGSNIVVVLPGKFGGGQGLSTAPNFMATKLTLAEVDKLARLGPPVESVGAGIEIPATVSYLGKSKYTTIGGLTAEYQKMRNLVTSKGRMISVADNSASRNVINLGQSLAETLFGRAEPLGKNVTVGEQKFQVVGILSPIGAGGFGVDINNIAFIPLTSVQKVFGVKGVQAIGVKARDKESIGQVKNMVGRELRKSLKEDDFSVVDSSSLLATINQILGVLTAALGGIAAISLVVGGVGIMNIMLVSVTERTREIGLRKAVGAKPKDILAQFVVEAVTLSVIGGVAGILIGAAGAMVMSKFFPAAVSFWSVSLAFGVSASVGVIFGVAPALKASRLNPIDALRYE